MPRWVAVMVLGMVLGGTLAGCGGAPAPAPPPAPVPIDGRYGGLLELSRGRAIDCGTESPITLTVANHAFTYHLPQPQAAWNPVLVFNATIAPDGTFNVRTGPDSMSGQVSGGTMQGQIIGDVCAFTFSAARGGVY